MLGYAIAATPHRDGGGNPRAFVWLPNLQKVQFLAASSISRENETALALQGGWGAIIYCVTNNTK